MKPIFSRGPSLQIRLILAVLVALGIIIADSRLGTFSQIRTYMDTAVSPFYFVSNAPRELLDCVSQTLASRDQLELENRALRQELLLKNSELLMLGQYKQENARLRELLGSPLRQDEQKMVTQVISTVNDPYSDQVVIDKGSVNGVYEGQPVISDKGVVGQVVAVAKLTSRVLLICDATHALPIQVLRNDIRVIAAGNGCTDDLQLEHLPANTDIRVGDVLVTSGLGGRFPEGYPVAVVSSVKLDTQRAYTVIQARPTAGLQRLRYLLLLWGADRNGANPMTPEEVHRVANERQMDDDAAVLLMVDSNLQRENILPSERAFAYKMKLEALKNQGARSDLTSAQVAPKLSTEKIGEEVGMSKDNVKRYIRLTNLVPELLDMVDEKKIAFNPAVELSYLDEAQQRDFLEAMNDTQNAPSLSQAQRLKKLAQEGHFSYDVAFAVMGEEKKDELDKVVIKNDTLRKYFPRSYTPKQMEDTIIKLLEQWQRKQQRQNER